MRPEVGRYPFLCSEHGWHRTPIKPVFFAPTDIQPGGLTDELQERLKDSKNLIVICSPNSARSKWVGEEISFFHSLGRTKQIHFFIVDGTPHSNDPEKDCFNPIVKELGLPEILGANVHEKIFRWSFLNKERAYVQLISKLLGVDFDTIWKRHRRLLVQKAIAWGIGIIAVLAIIVGVWRMNQPVDVKVQLNVTSVHNNQLPPMKDAVVSMSLNNEIKIDTIHSLNGITTFVNIPHRFLNKPVKVSIRCRDFIDVDTSLMLTECVLLDIHRNPSVYGDIHFRLWNPDLEKAIGNTTLEIDGNKVTSDIYGHITLTIPLKSQKKAYPVKAAFPLANDSIIMPCGKDDVLLTK